MQAFMKSYVKEAIETLLWSSDHYEDDDSDGICFDDLVDENSDIQWSLSGLKNVVRDVKAFLNELDHTYMCLPCDDDTLASGHYSSDESYTRTCLWELIEDFGCDSHPFHDFILTRNGHGAGFWDGDYDYDIELSNGDTLNLGEELTRVAKSYDEIHLYLGDDDKIYAA